MAITHVLRDKLLECCRSVLEVCGVESLSKPGYDGLDEKLSKYLPSSGTFIEAGAYDGYYNSNTYYLESMKGWSGLLVEPVPELAEICKKRRRAIVANCALVPFAYNRDSSVVRFGDRCSFVEDAAASFEELQHRTEQVQQYASGEKIVVPARTLSSLIEENGLTDIDFLSLDVEGYESEALRGLDMNRHRPRFVLCECHSDEALSKVVGALGERYCLVGRLTARDYLWRDEASIL